MHTNLNVTSSGVIFFVIWLENDLKWNSELLKPKNIFFPLAWGLLETEKMNGSEVKTDNKIYIFTIFPLSTYQLHWP